MSRKQKLLNRFLCHPKDFTYNELVTLLESFGFVEVSNSGSSRRFCRAEGQVIDLHKPHPENTLKPYVIRKVENKLREYGLLE